MLFIYTEHLEEIKKYSNNVLVAAGDGSNSSGLLEEREKDERGRWNKGLPKAVGLFPYQTVLSEEQISKNKKEQKVEPLRVTSNKFFTAGNNQLTEYPHGCLGLQREKTNYCCNRKKWKVISIVWLG